MRRPVRVQGDAVAALKLFDRFVALLASIVRLVCIVLTIALFTIVVVAIVARYGFGQAVSWTEEVPRYLLIWISFLAAASCVLLKSARNAEVLSPATSLALWVTVIIGHRLLRHQRATSLPVKSNASPNSMSMFSDIISSCVLPVTPPGR